MEVDRLFENNRIGITIRRLRDLSASNIEEALSCIKAEFKSPLIDSNKKIIKEFYYNEGQNEYHLVVVIDVPIKVKELIFENGNYAIKSRVENFARNVNAIVRLDSSNIVIISQSRREVQRFSKYMKEMTSGIFLPTVTKFDQECLKDALNEFNSINHLKFSANDIKKIITFKGDNLLEDSMIKDILSSDNYSINEIGGYFPLSPENSLKSYISHKGRMTITGDPGRVDSNDLFGLVTSLERMQEKP